MLAPYVGPMLAHILLIVEKMRNFEKCWKTRDFTANLPRQASLYNYSRLQQLLAVNASRQKRLRALSVPVDFLMSRNFTAEKSGQKGFSLLDQQCIRSKRDIETLDF